VIVNELIEAEALANKPDYKLNAKKKPSLNYEENIENESPNRFLNHIPRNPATKRMSQHTRESPSLS
jgi:hypothetical protein